MKVYTIIHIAVNKCTICIVPYIGRKPQSVIVKQLIREAFKKNCDYSDIVPISFYTHPPEGDRDSNYRDIQL